MHTIAKFQENRWSRSAEIFGSSKFNFNILLKVSILDARRRNKSRTQISVSLQCLLNQLQSAWPIVDCANLEKAFANSVNIVKCSKPTPTSKVALSKIFRKLYSRSVSNSFQVNFEVLQYFLHLFLLLRCATRRLVHGEASEQFCLYNYYHYEYKMSTWGGVSDHVRRPLLEERIKELTL